jgi:hypothetical protein
MNKSATLLSVVLIFTSALSIQADTVEGVQAKQINSLSEVPSWLDFAVTPTTNPIWFEDARITSEVRPIFMQHWIDDGFATQGGDIRLYALQARWAITDKLALIAVKDGIVDFDPGVGDDEVGFADIAAGLKYQIYRNDEHQVLITPGLTLEFPTGSRDVFQGNGTAMATPFVSFLKGWDEFQVAGNVGFHIPFDFDEETAIARYSLHAHYHFHKYFIPFIESNGITVLSSSPQFPGLDSERFDVINFGAGNAEGATFITLGAGVRSKIFSNVELGVAYERLVTGQETLFDHRITADIIYRF